MKIRALPRIPPGGLRAAEFFRIEGAYVEAEETGRVHPLKNVRTVKWKALGAIQAKR